MKINNIQIFLLFISVQITNQQIDEYCRAVDNLGKCTQCAMTYLDEQQKCQEPTSKIDNCLSYMELNGKMTCRVCRYGYQLNQTLNKCDSISINNCLEAADEDCLICKQNIQVENGTCNKDNIIHIPNCMLSTGSIEEPQCMRCEAEHTLKVDSNNQLLCVPVTHTTENCQMLLENDQCYVCEFNYYMTRLNECLRSTKYSVSLFDNASKIISYLFIFLSLY